MYCAYHPINAATVQCSNCGRALCPACDHRIKGFAYCQDCIVQGVGRLSQPAAPPPGAESRLVPMPLFRAHPRRAALFALIPGLGAVYNRQNTKALVHFVVTFGLAETADATNLMIFGVGAFVFWLYSILDAFRTAEAMQMGINVAADEERLRQSVQQHAWAWGAILVFMGGIFLIANLNLFTLNLSPQRVWPILLIAIGAIFLQDYFRQRKNAPAEVGRPSLPRSVVTQSLPLPSYANQTGEQTGSEQRRSQSRP